MTSLYLKCDGCGTVLDRFPKELVAQAPGQPGTFGNGEARPYARSLGWVVKNARVNVDYCPECVERCVDERRERRAGVGDGGEG